ncbi:hypothetical protein IPZ58_05085 [Streptomyces roseoverticillatus]|uniref:hypothetical protein n=1 Tax=Streptomyces roseoverticillatus TaxID=66429 RepID=UPI001F456359|nr:hypothetical protein [Streptomyces roseoverticillatus]MCF3100949.1 hypothetical protein [Streptomyces roseoverticillatus]
MLKGAVMERRRVVLDDSLISMADMPFGNYTLALLTTGIMITKARSGDTTCYRVFTSDLTDEDDMAELAEFEHRHNVSLARNAITFEYVACPHPHLPGSTWHTHRLIVRTTDGAA